MCSILVAVIYTSDMAPTSSKEFHDIQENIECGFTLKLVREVKTYNQIHRTDKYPKYRPVI